MAPTESLSIDKDLDSYPSRCIYCEVEDEEDEIQSYCHFATDIDDSKKGGKHEFEEKNDCS